MKYDVIIPLGSFCLPAIVLKKLKLRKQSLPFDWVTPLTLSNAIEFMSNNFEHFLDKDAFEMFNLELEKHIGYVNKKTKIEFIHDFSKNVVFDENYIIFEKKYKKHIKRLYDTINENKRILFIHFCEGKRLGSLDIEQIKSNFENLKNMFSEKEISLLYIYLNPNFSTDENFIYKIANNDLTIIDCFKEHPEPVDEAVYWKCYLNSLEKILKNYKLTFNLKNKINDLPKKMIYLFVCLIPIKKLRKTYKKILLDN